MKEKIIQAFLNLIKVKSIVTFVIMGILVYVVVNNQIEVATITAIIMLVIQNLFGRDKGGNNNGM